MLTAFKRCLRLLLIYCRYLYILSLPVNIDLFIVSINQSKFIVSLQDPYWEALVTEVKWKITVLRRWWHWEQGPFGRRQVLPSYLFWLFPSCTLPSLTLVHTLPNFLPVIPPCIIHSFIPVNSIAPLQVLYHSEALPTTARILYRSFTPKHTGNCR